VQLKDSLLLNSSSTKKTKSAGETKRAV